VFGAIAGAGAGIGLLLGGFLTEYLSLLAMLLTSVGMFGVFPAFNTATLGVDREDAGVGSATVNTAQQIGGSLGTSLLNTVATTATTRFLVGKAASPGVVAEATVHGYVTAFWWAAATFAVGAVITGLLLRGGVPLRQATPEAAPAPEAPHASEPAPA
jgi:hypothetical protein